MVMDRLEAIDKEVGGVHLTPTIWSVGPFVGAFVGPFVGAFVGPLVHSLVHSSVHSLVHWSIHRFIHWSIGPFSHSFTPQLLKAARLDSSVSSISHHQYLTPYKPRCSRESCVLEHGVFESQF